MILNHATEMVYVGQTAKSIEERFTKHIDSVRRGSMSRLHQAIREYGIECFEIIPLEQDLDPKLLNERETYWINYLDSTSPNVGYNMTPGDTRGRCREEMTGAEIKAFQEHGRKGGKANFIELSDEQKLRMKQGKELGFTFCDLAFIYGIGRTKIQRVLGEMTVDSK